MVVSAFTRFLVRLRKLRHQTTTIQITPQIGLSLAWPLPSPPQQLRHSLKTLKISCEIDSKLQTVKAEAVFALPLRELLAVLQLVGSHLNLASKHAVAQSKQLRVFVPLQVRIFRSHWLQIRQSLRHRLFHLPTAFKMQRWRISVRRARWHNAYTHWRWHVVQRQQQALAQRR